jgi:hypothetical protein
MRALLLAGLLASAPALADDLILRDGQNTIRLSTAPCHHSKVIDLLRPEFREQFRHGFGVFNGRQVGLCWILSDPLTVTVVDDEGDSGAIPLAAFRVEKGI